MTRLRRVAAWFSILERSQPQAQCRFSDLFDLNWWFVLAALLLTGLVLDPEPARAQQSVSLRQTPAAVQNGKAQLLGPYNPSQKLRLVFGLQPPHMQEEEQFLRDLQNKNSPQFHKYLSAEEWNARFAPSAQDEQAVVDWAAGQGFTITQRYANRLLVGVEAPAAVIQIAFGVSVNRYQLAGKEFFSNDRDPSVPSSLAAVIHSLNGLNNLQVAHAASRNPNEVTYPDYSPGPAYQVGTHLQGDGTGKKLSPATGTSKKGDGAPSPNDFYNPYSPADIYGPQAYDYSALANLGHCCNPLDNPGNSPPETSIAIAIWFDFSDNDINNFMAFNGLAYNVQRYFVDGTPKCCDFEPTLDVEWATATSNSFNSSQNTAEVHVYEGANNHFATLLDAVNRALSDGHARVLSMSWGLAEPDYFSETIDSFHAVFDQMLGQGWTLVSSSGDGGATADCGNYLSVSYPASDPDVTAAGGTTLAISYYGYNSETGWTGGPEGCSNNDGGSGGGCSDYFTAPPYQGNQACGAGSRSMPDIALNSDWLNEPQLLYFEGSWYATGGTSIASPEIAGFYAQENAYLLYLESIVGNSCGGNLSSPCAPMGNANYYLYDEGLNQHAPHYPFYDITSGCNNNDITQLYGLNYFCASNGYDMVTGWGSANMLQLAWAINNYLAGDSSGPSVSFSGPMKNHWYNTDQTISWNISDTTGNGHLPNGVAGFTFYWDTDPGDPYSEPGGSSVSNSFYSGPQYATSSNGSVLLSSAGVGCHTAIVRAWDNAGQASANSSDGLFCFDNVPPSTVANLTGKGQYPYYDGLVTVALAATDGNGSGVADTMYQLDGGSWHTYQTPLVVAKPGNHTVAYYSTDVAGNIENTDTTGFIITRNSSYLLTVLKSGSASGLVTSGDGDIYCGDVCSHLYYDGTQVTLTATPAQGAVFTGWSGCDSSSGNVCTLEVTDDHTVTAIFNVPSALRFVVVTPCRVADTRGPTGPFGGPPINGEDYRDYVIPDGPCGIPSTAAAYSLNITVVPRGPLGYLTVWPSGLTRPAISTLNSVDGRVKANAAIVPAGNQQAISVFVTDTSDVILDIDGYFVAAPAPSALAFYPLTPCRVVDTRLGQGGPTLQGQTEYDYTIQGMCGIPSGAQAYSLNFTVIPVNNVPVGYLTVWPQGEMQPNVSTLNDYTATVVANAGIVPAGGKGGEISAYAYTTGEANLVVDVNGYFAPPGKNGLSLYSVSPCRVLDTRQGQGPFSGEMAVNVIGSPCAPPSQAQAYVLNATVVPQGSLGYLTLWPDGGSQPNVSTLNAYDGAITSNMAVVPTSNGEIDAYTSGSTDLILDISSYFAP